MIEMPSGHDWYDVSKPAGRTQDKTGRALPAAPCRGSADTRHEKNYTNTECVVVEKRKGANSRTMAESMGITVRHVQKLRAGLNTPKGKAVLPAAAGRPAGERPPETRSRPRSPLAESPNPGQAECGAVPEGQTRQFQGASYTTYCGSPATGRRTKAGAPQAGIIRALALQLHAAYRLQAAGRQAPDACWDDASCVTGRGAPT